MAIGKWQRVHGGHSSWPACLVAACKSASRYWHFEYVHVSTESKSESLSVILAPASMVWHTQIKDKTTIILLTTHPELVTRGYIPIPL